MSTFPKFFKRSKNRTSADSHENEPAMNISAPSNVTHDCHVGFDMERGTFTGLPLAWRQWLQESNIGYANCVIFMLHTYVRYFQLARIFL